MESRKPLLSICIPTCNRAELLGIGLKNIIAEAAPFGEEVEIVVADNASEDHTPEVVKAAGYPIVYGRQAVKVVFPSNLMYVACDLAKGEHVLLIGDDDLLLPGGVGRILGLLKERPDLDYLYLNVGWIHIKERNRVILKDGGRLPPDPDRKFQCDEHVTKVLPRLEDVVFCKGSDPYAMFSTIFCYVARRSLYLEGRPHLEIYESFDDATQPLDNMFPHAKLTLGAVAGKPIGFIGEPTIMQGSYHQEWRKWIGKTMIYGHCILFQWLETTPFAKDALEVLWEGLARKSGQLMVRMMDEPDENMGMDIIRREALPALVQRPVFWSSFMEELRLWNETDYEAREIIRRTKALLAKPGMQDASLGLWGIRGRGHRIIRFDQELRERLSVAVDRERHLHGEKLGFTEVTMRPPEELAAHPVDVLMVATRRDLASAVCAQAAQWLPVGAYLVSLEGLRRVSEGGEFKPVYG